MNEEEFREILLNLGYKFDINKREEEFCLLCIKKGFQKGKLEERERILNYINELLNECKRNNPLSDYWAGKEIGLEQLQKEINSQTEQNSDKEVAQPYSKSDKTTKGFILSDEQFQKEVDFAKKEIGGNSR